MIKQILAVTLAAVAFGGSAIAGESKSDTPPSVADCDKMKGAERDTCVREAKAKAGGTAGRGTTTPSSPNESNPGAGSKGY